MCTAFAASPDDVWFNEGPQQRRMQTSKGPVEYVDVGQGIPVLYFHGNGVGNDAILVLEKSLVEDGCRLIVPNRPGYYGTPLESGTSIEDCADLAAELLEQLGIERAVVIGTSAGGPPASCFAGRHPQKTIALILQCALSYPLDTRRWVPGGNALALLILRNLWLFRPLLRFANRRQARDPNFVSRCMSKKRFAELRTSPPLRSLRSLLMGLLVRCAERPEGTETDWANSTGKPWLAPGSVECPTLILHDRADAVAPFAHAEWAKRCVPLAQLCELQLGGHLIWVGRDREKMCGERAAFIRRHADHFADDADSASVSRRHELFSQMHAA
jgi:pimeloyl-ACP methyl ester carboxylesterase